MILSRGVAFPTTTIQAARQLLPLLLLLYSIEVLAYGFLEIAINDVNFNEIVKKTLQNEGGFVNNKNDTGGATNYGISLRFLKNGNIDINLDGYINIQDILALDKAKASKIYQEHFWDNHQYKNIRNAQIAAKIFDMSVNMGAYQTHKILQKAINQVNDKYLAVDGIFGTNTLATINKLIRIGKSEQLLNAIRTQCAIFYKSLVIANPKLKVFLKGWLRRAAQ